MNISGNKIKVVKSVGPILITVLVIAWTYIVSPYSKYGDDWAVFPVLGAAVAIFIWHIFLVLKPGESGRFNMAGYAILHGSVFFIIFIRSLMLISKDSF